MFTPTSAIVYTCMLGLGDMWQDFTFVPIKLHVVKTIKSLNVFRCFY